MREKPGLQRFLSWRIGPIDHVISLRLNDQHRTFGLGQAGRGLGLVFAQQFNGFLGMLDNAFI